MRAIALPIVILMLTATFAGCAGGDPDGNDNSGIDMEILNEMIDDNLQDFINNTTVTVINNFHNNTTYIIDDGDYSSFNYPGMTGSGNSSFGIIYTIDFEFTLNQIWGNQDPDPGDRDNSFTSNWTYYDYLTNQERYDSFTFDCDVYYLVGSANNSSNLETYWENNNYYDDAWSDNGLNNTMRNMLHSIAWDEDLRYTCDDSFLGYDDDDDSYRMIIYSVTIPEGFGLRCASAQVGPMLFASDYSSYFGDVYNYSNTGNVYAFIDGIPHHCGWNNIVGGEKDLQLVIWANYLEVNRNYRLIYAFEMIPVTPIPDPS
jgi:hypothetical protein